MGDPVRRQVVFELNQDDHANVFSREALWAVDISAGRYVLDNIPFYLAGFSVGDTVECMEHGGDLIARRAVAFSQNSTYRLYVCSLADVDSVRQGLHALGCDSEVSNLPELMAVNIPDEVDVEAFRSFILGGHLAGTFDVEEASLRGRLLASVTAHPIRDTDPTGR